MVATTNFITPIEAPERPAPPATGGEGIEDVLVANQSSNEVVVLLWDLTKVRLDYEVEKIFTNIDAMCDQHYNGYDIL